MTVISDQRVKDIAAWQKFPEDMPLIMEHIDLALDLRDARAALKVAVEALEQYQRHNGKICLHSECCLNPRVAATALEQIRKLGI